MAAAQTSAAAVSTALGPLPSGPDWGLRPTTALTYLVVLAEGVPRAQAQLKLGPGVLGSEPASASWSQARTFFLLPPGRISPGKGSVTRNLEGDQNPGVPAHGATSSGPLLSQVPGVLAASSYSSAQESGVPVSPPFRPRNQGPTPGIGPVFTCTGTEMSAPLGGHGRSPNGRAVTAQSSSVRLGQTGLRRRPRPAFLIPQKFASRI